MVDSGGGEELDAVSTSPAKVAEVLKKPTTLRENLELVTYTHEIGEDESKECRFPPLS